MYQTKKFLNGFKLQLPIFFFERLTVTLSTLMIVDKMMMNEYNENDDDVKMDVGYKLTIYGRLL